MTLIALTGDKCSKCNMIVAIYKQKGAYFKICKKSCSGFVPVQSYGV